MPTTAASGPITETEELFATMLADVTAFRTLVDAANQTQALEDIYYDALPPPASGHAYTKAELQGLRPFALISTSDKQGGYKWRHDGSGFDQWTYRQAGSIWLQLEKDIDTDDLADPGEYMRIFKNEIGGIVQSFDTNNPGLCELAGQAGYLAIEMIELIGPFRSTEEEDEGEGDHLFAFLEIEWGRR